MRDGRAWGLMIMSGRTPLALNGMSFSGTIRPMVPFCPAREAILSPMAGTRVWHMRILATRSPGAPSVTKILST